MILEYGWVLLVLMGLEGILAADNALVIAIMVKHLPEKERKKALFYGLAGAFLVAATQAWNRDSRIFDRRLGWRQVGRIHTVAP